MSTPIVRKTIPLTKPFTERRGLKARPHRRFACAKLEGTYAITRGARMEAYKQEFIKFMVESDVLKVRQLYASRRPPVPVLYERRRLSDGLSAQAERVLRPCHPR